MMMDSVSSAKSPMHRAALNAQAERDDIALAAWRAVECWERFYEKGTTREADVAGYMQALRRELEAHPFTRYEDDVRQRVTSR